MVTKVGILIEVLIPQDRERAQIVRQPFSYSVLYTCSDPSEHQVATRSWRGACTIF
jgi:hypothetical protein